MYLFQGDQKVKIAIGNETNSDDYHNWKKVLFATDVIVEDVKNKRDRNTNIYDKISKFRKNLVINSL